MNCNEIKNGLRVRTTELGATEGFLINPRHLDCRKAGITGTVSGYVPGHGGDVWWVKHDDSADIGAYCFTELEALVMPNMDSSITTLLQELKDNNAIIKQNTEDLIKVFKDTQTNRDVLLSALERTVGFFRKIAVDVEFRDLADQFVDSLDEIVKLTHKLKIHERLWI